jgi:hypothetical protein
VVIKRTDVPLAFRSPDLAIGEIRHSWSLREGIGA